MKDGYNYDLDVHAAAQELTRRGASSIVAGGDVTAASGAALAAPKVQGLAGLVLVSPVPSLPGWVREDFRPVEPALESLTVPVLIASSVAPTVDAESGYEDFARSLAAASPKSRLDVVPGKSYGAQLVNADAGLRDRIVSFAGEVQPTPWYERFVWLWAGAVLVLGLLGSLLVFRLKNNRARAVSGDEAR